MTRFHVILGAVLAMSAASAHAQSFPRMDELLGRYKSHVEKLHEELDGMRTDPRNADWVKKQVAFLYERDQYARRFVSEGYKDEFNEDERRYFLAKMNESIEAGLKESVTSLKTMIGEHEWLKISKFGERTDNEAWVLAANAEKDRPFQATVLKVLAKLWPAKETSPRNYAFLSDQLAVAGGKLQTYGTQGRCAGPGRWDPSPIEAQETVDERRGELGMEPLKDYIERFKEICQ